MLRIPICIGLFLCLCIHPSAQSFTAIGGVINSYAQIISFHSCTNTAQLTDATFFKSGDTILIIQMKGASIDSSNSNSFGNILQYRNAGHYEINYIKDVHNNTISFLNALKNDYDFSFGGVQIIKIPSYQNAQLPKHLPVCRGMEQQVACLPLS